MGILQWLMLLGMIGSSREQAEAQKEYEETIDEAIDEAKGFGRERIERAPEIFEEEIQPAETELLDLQEEVTGGAEELVESTDQSRLDFLQGFVGRGQDLVSGFEGRYAFAQDQLDQLGTQGRADINRVFDEELGRLNLQLQRSGMSSSTAAEGVGLGVAERRAGTLGRFGEGLTRERIGVLSALSGDRLGAQGALDASQAAYDAALRGDTLASEQALLNYQLQTGGALADFYSGKATNLTNVYTNTSGDYLNLLQNINYVPPPPNRLPGQFGANFVDPVSSPNDGAFWNPNSGIF